MTELNKLMTTREIVKERSFKYVSLFAGIGGFDAALNELGGKCVMASEIDKFAKKSYEVMYGVEPKGDITKIRSEDIPKHDLLTAGFPCQTFSVAGERAGMAYKCEDCELEQTITFEEYADCNFECEKCGGHIEAIDGRGLLFFEVARVARDKQPKMLLLENVKGLVGHDKGRTLDTMVKTLNDIGYTIDFEVLNTKYFGLPQNRERIFIVAYRDDLVEATGWSEESRKGNTVVPKGKRRLHEYGNVKSFDFPFPENNTVTSRLIDVLETEVDEKYYLDDEKTAGLIEELEGGAVKVNEATKKGYTVAETGDSINVAHPNSKTRRGRVGKQIANTLVASGVEQAVIDVKGITYNCKDGIKEDRDIAHSLSASDWRGLNRNQNQTAVFESKEVRPVITPERASKRQNGRRFKEDGEEMFTLTAQDRHGVMESNFECMVDDTQGFDGTRLYKEYSPTLRSERNGLKILESLPMECEIPTKESSLISERVGNVDSHPFSKKYEFKGFENKEVSPALLATDYKAPKCTLTKQHRIRKLTPLECWRLQGFDDEQHNAVEQAGISNSQRYKQAGNAVSVPVIKAIAENMIKFLDE